VVIPRPSSCPCCNNPLPLIGHGWYQRKELEKGDEDCFGVFFIYRWLCKKCRKTISMHPDFSHSRKRYRLLIVIHVLSERFLEDRSRYAVSEKHDLLPRTIQRWERGLCSDFCSKWLCFFPKIHGPPYEHFSASLCHHFVHLGKGEAAIGAARAMAHLHQLFQCRLY